MDTAIKYGLMGMSTDAAPAETELNAPPRIGMQQSHPADAPSAGMTEPVAARGPRKRPVDVVFAMPSTFMLKG